MTTPDILYPPSTSVSSGTLAGDYAYKVMTTSTHPSWTFDSGYTYYDLWHVSQSQFLYGGINAIKVQHSNDTWHDANTSGQPTSVDDNANGTVYLYNNSTLIMSFVKPTTASWISSGGGTTNSEGSSNPSGSFYFNSQSQLVFVVNSTSPSSDGNIVYKIFRRTVNQVMGHAYTVTHSNGSPTEFSIGLDLSLYDRWELRVESSTALVDSATMSVYSTAPKKVFCNFW